MALFARVIDLGKLCQLLDMMPVRERREVEHRVGLLNLYNPQHPERFMHLDLTVRDQREYAKILIALAAAEPGENWKDERFFAPWKNTWVAGWHLPQQWMEEDGKGDTGCERVGLLELRYTSKAKNCAPDKQVRAVLKMRTLCGAETTYHTN